MSFYSFFNEWLLPSLSFSYLVVYEPFYLIIIRHLIRRSGLFPSRHNTFARICLNIKIEIFTFEIFQLKRERERLSAMMAHLHSLPSKSLSIDSIFSLNQVSTAKPCVLMQLHIEVGEYVVILVPELFPS